MGNTEQSLYETRESLGELIRTVGRISNMDSYQLNQTDKDRLKKAKVVLSKYSNMDKSQIPVKSQLEPESKSLSAEEYYLSEQPMPDNGIGHISHYMESFASMRVEQAKKEWEKEKAIKQLFIGKVTDILGFEKTVQLLKEANEAFKPLNNGN